MIPPEHGYQPGDPLCLRDLVLAGKPLPHGRDTVWLAERLSDDGAVRRTHVLTARSDGVLTTQDGGVIWRGWPDEWTVEPVGPEGRE